MGNAVLVTGGSGFVGSWVIRELLQRGMKPVVFDLHRNDERWRRVIGSAAKDIEFVAGRLQDRSLLKQTIESHQVSHVIHLAALLTPDCQNDPYLGCEVNVLGSVGLFEILRAYSDQICGLSYASSYAVYGPESDDCEFGPTFSKNRPPSFYGAFKLAVDMIAEQYWNHYGIPSVGIRPHVAYGPERTVGMTAGPSQAARAAAAGECYAINYTGIVGYDYVEDIASAFVRGALETPAGATVVDLESHLITTEEFVSVINRIVPDSVGRIRIDGPAIPSNIPPRPRFIREIYSDWKTTSLEDGVRATIDFYRSATSNQV